MVGRDSLYVHMVIPHKYGYLRSIKSQTERERGGWNRDLNEFWGRALDTRSDESFGQREIQRATDWFMTAWHETWPDWRLNECLRTVSRMGEQQRRPRGGGSSSVMFTMLVMMVGSRPKFTPLPKSLWPQLVDCGHPPLMKFCWTGIAYWIRVFRAFQRDRYCFTDTQHDTFQKYLLIMCSIGIKAMNMAPQSKRLGDRLKGDQVQLFLQVYTGKVGHNSYAPNPRDSSFFQRYLDMTDICLEAWIDYGMTFRTISCRSCENWTHRRPFRLASVLTHSPIGSFEESNSIHTFQWYRP